MNVYCMGECKNVPSEYNQLYKDCTETQTQQPGPSIPFQTLISSTALCAKHPTSAFNPLLVSTMDYSMCYLTVAIINVKMCVKNSISL